MTSPVSQFLNQYANSNDKGRYFTRSQVYIAYRAFLSRTGLHKLMLMMDYRSFSSEFEEESKRRLLQTKLLGRNKYYKLCKSETNSSTSNDLKTNDTYNKKKINIKLSDFNIYLCCKLCCGYLVEATTITECLHSFCKSCIVKHLHVKPSCPVCNTLVHSTNPFSSLKLDIVLQDIVNKMLPGIVESEEKRMHEFEKCHNSDHCAAFNPKSSYQRHSLVTVILEWIGKEKSALPAKDLIQKYIRLSEQVTVAHLAQFVLQKQEKIDKSLNPLCKCEILSGDVVLPPILSVEDVIQNKLDFVNRRGMPVFHFNLKPTS